jgi:4-hydroxy-4-methyl-2-oxoglutarate aldolase
MTQLQPTPEQLEYLRSQDSPTIINAIETFDTQPRTAGYMSPDIRCHFPELGPMVGYAVTAVVSAQKSDNAVPRSVLWDHVLSVPGPRILVMHDIDDPVVGAFWGEVQSNIFTALGCVGTITDGSVRDLPVVRELGFRFASKFVSVSHGYTHVVEVGVPVAVGGLTVRPGDLLHGDEHGIVQVPLETVGEMPGAVEKILERERRIIELCQSPEFSVQKLKEIS